MLTQDDVQKLIKDAMLRGVSRTVVMHAPQTAEELARLALGNLRLREWLVSHEGMSAADTQAALSILGGA